MARAKNNNNKKHRAMSLTCTTREISVAAKEREWNVMVMITAACLPSLPTRKGTVEKRRGSGDLPTSLFITRAAHLGACSNYTRRSIISHAAILQVANELEVHPAD